MLPESLLCLLSATLSLAQTRQELPLNEVSSFNTLQLPNPPSFSIPQQAELSISVALCSTSNSVPRFFVSNASSSGSDPGPSGGPDVFELFLHSGQGSWTGTFDNGGLFAVSFSGTDSLPFEIGVSTDGPLHQTLTSLPFFGDTTANQAIIFSPPFAKPPVTTRSFPNYTLPPPSLPQPDPPTTPNFTLVLSPTSSGLASGPNTGCFLSAQNTSGTIANESSWIRDEEGWRHQWLMGALTPSTNYTAFVIQNSTQVSGPIYFATKSAAFSCPLVHSVSSCPGVAYSVPLSAPPAGAIAYDDSNLPDAVISPLLSYMANFTVVITTFACGRDWYSPLVGCDDCQREYRKWLCAISFTRCSEPSPTNPNAFTAIPADPGATGLSATRQTDAAGGQQVLSALVPQQSGDPTRNSFLPVFNSTYDVLLPCLEVCNSVDRSCPPFVGFQCPTPDFNAAASYGVGYIDSADGDKDKGLTGVAQDRWGNVWCNKI